MPTYKCDIYPLNKIILNSNGVREPLCNNCIQPDCENPIHSQVVYVLGKPTEWRVWVSNKTPKQVVDCIGYIPEKK